MENHEIHPQFDDAAIPMPRQMVQVPDVFQFSFKAAKTIQAELGSGASLILVLEEVVEFIRSSSLAEDEVELVTSLIQDEIEVIAFSQSARSSVIRL